MRRRIYTHTKYPRITEHRNKYDEYNYIPDVSEYLNGKKTLLDIINDNVKEKEQIIYLEPYDIWK